MEFFIYFLGFFFINVSTDIFIPKEYQIKLFSWEGLIQQLLIVAGVLCIHYSGMLK
jgi:hypothetical protein